MTTARGGDEELLPTRGQSFFFAFFLVLLGKKPDASHCIEVRLHTHYVDIDE